MRVLRCVWAAAVWLALVSPSLAQSGFFDWASASQLGSYAGIRRANVTVTSPRTMNINCLQIDTFTPGLRFYTTPAGSQPEVISQTTRQFITTSRTTSTPLVAAINAGPWSPYNPTEWNTPLPQNLSGLAVSQGALVSPGDGSPSFLSTTSGAASMAVTSGTTIGGVQTAVSGFGFALANGTTIASGTDLHPRTGIGLSQDSRYVYFMTIDGRQTASRGATWQEVGSYLQYFGSYNGINMDGGGSTTMAWWNPTTSTSQLLNVPVGNPFTNSGERYNANNIGVYYTATPPAPTTSITQVLSDTFDFNGGGGGPANLAAGGWEASGSLGTSTAGQEGPEGQQPQPAPSGQQWAYFQIGGGAGTGAAAMRKGLGVAPEANAAYTVTFFNGKRGEFPAITNPFQAQLYAGDPGADGTGGTLIGSVSVTQTANSALGYTVGRFTTGTSVPVGNLFVRVAVPANSGDSYRQLLIDSLAIEQSPGIFNESFDRGGGGNGNGGSYSNVQALANNGWQYTLTTTYGAAPGQESSPSTQPTPDSGVNWAFLNAFGNGGQKIWIDTGYNIANLGDTYLLQFYTGGKNESSYLFTGTLTASLWAGNPNAGGTLLGSGIGINPAASVSAFNSIEIVNSVAATADLWVQFETGASGNGGFQQALIDSVVVQLVPVPEPSTLALAALGLLALCSRLVSRPAKA